MLNRDILTDLFILRNFSSKIEVTKCKLSILRIHITILFLLASLVTILSRLRVGVFFLMARKL